MTDHHESLDTLKDIRSLMERSSRFISLSGLAGVFSGIFALLGALAAYWRVNIGPWAIRDRVTPFGTGNIVHVDTGTAVFLVVDAMLILLLSLGVSYLLTRKKAQRKKQPLWGPHSRHMLLSLLLPLVTGGFFCLILFSHGLVGLIAPTTLVFYGISLISAGKFTLEEISYLGISEVLLGLISLYYLGYGLVFWAIGFGLLHIIYGILMYIRHDR